MLCPKCGAQTKTNSSFCNSCGATLPQSATYDLILRDVTSNKKAITLTMEITRKNLEQATQLLNRPRAQICSNLTLAKATEFKNRYLKCGVETDFRKNRTSTDTHSQDYSELNLSDSFSKSTIETKAKIEEKISPQPKNQPQYVVEDFTPKQNEEANSRKFINTLLLSLTAIFVIMMSVVGYLYYNQTANRTKPSLPKINDTINIAKESLEQESAQEGQLESKSRVVGEKTLAQIKPTNQPNKYIHKKGVEKKDKKRNNKSTIVQKGTSFVGTTNLPDQTIVEISIEDPEGKISTEREIVSRLKFQTRLLPLLKLGDYHLTVKIADQKFQKPLIIKELFQLFKNDLEQDSLLIDEIININKEVTITELLDEKGLIAKINRGLKESFKEFTVDTEVVKEKKNILIKGSAKDPLQFIVKSAKEFALANQNSNLEIEILHIIINNIHYYITAIECQNALKLSQMTEDEKLFSKTIINLLKQ